MGSCGVVEEEEVEKDKGFEKGEEGSRLGGVVVVVVEQELETAEL